MDKKTRIILRLNICPKCKYDLSGLPIAHNCPECGFAYSEDFFDVQGCSWDLRTGFSSKLLFIIFIVIVIGIAIVLVYWWYGLFNYGDLLKSLISLVAISGVVLFTRYMIQNSPPVYKTFTHEGMLVNVGNDLVTCDWCEVKSFEIAKSRLGYWRLLIQHRPLSIRQSFMKQGAFARVDMKLECTDDEAEAIRTELQRRIDDARQKNAETNGENTRGW